MIYDTSKSCRNATSVLIPKNHTVNPLKKFAQLVLTGTQDVDKVPPLAGTTGL